MNEFENKGLEDRHIVKLSRQLVISKFPQKIIHLVGIIHIPRGSTKEFLMLSCSTPVFKL